MSNKSNPFGIVSEDTFADKFDELIAAVSNSATAYQNKMMYTTDLEGKSVLMQGTEDVTEDVKALLSPDLSIYAEKESVESSLSELSTEIEAKLEGKADSGSSYTKDQCDEKFLVRADLVPINSTVEDVRERVEYIENNPLYAHNIMLKYSHPAAKLASKGSDGRALVSMTIINKDKDSYSFSHNTTSMDTEDSKNVPKIMKEDDAWQLLRLYRAIQISTHKDTSDKRSISGILMLVREGAGYYHVVRAVADSACSGYQNSDNDTYTSWVRMLTLRGSSTEEWNDAESNIGMMTLSIPCGHPTFHTDTNEEIVNTNFIDFVNTEYRATDSDLNYYSTYFCQNRIECTDVVVKL